MNYKTDVLDKGMMMTWEGIPLTDLSQTELIEALYQTEMALRAELQQAHIKTVKTWSMLQDAKIKRGVRG